MLTDADYIDRLLKPLPTTALEVALSGVFSSNCTWSNLCTTTATPTVEEILATAAKFRAEKVALDRDFAASLRRCVEINRLSLQQWADLLWVPLPELQAVLAGTEAPSGYLWERVRQLADQQRQKPQKEQP